MYLQTYTGSAYLGLPINRNYLMVPSYLNSIHCVLNEALSEHPRTLVVGAILRMPEISLCKNEFDRFSCITRFIESFKSRVKADINRKRNLGKRVHNTSIRYVWCREKSFSKNEHFHIFLLLNGDTYWQLGSLKYPTPGHISCMINEAWNCAIGSNDKNYNGLVEYSGQPVKLDARLFASYYRYNTYACIYMNSYESVFYWMSYLAKVDTKKFGDGVRNFGCSQAKNINEINFRKTVLSLNECN